MEKKFEYFWMKRELIDKLTKLDLEAWLKTELFTINWWLLLFILTIPWIHWIKLVDRKRILEILIVGFFAANITTLADVIGNEYGLWGYPTQLIPTAPRAFSFDFGIIPVTYMLIYQYSTTRKSFIIYLISMAGVFGFIGDLIAVKFELIYYFKWNPFFSFLYYIFVGLLIKIILQKLINISR